MADSLHILTTDEIWAAKDIEERVVDVPEWGGAVRIRTFSKKEADEMRKQSMRWNPRTRQEESDNELYEPLLFVYGVIEPRFTLEQYNDQLKGKSAVAVARIIRAIMDASGLSQAAVDEADKSAEGSGAEVRVPPGTRVGDDANGTLTADVSKRVRALDSAVQP